MNDDDLHEDSRRLRESRSEGGLYESSGKRHRHRHSSSRYWITPLLVGIVVETFIIVGLVIWLSQLEQEKRGHALREEELVQKIEAGKMELQKIRLQFENLKQDKLKSYLPNLTPLKLDQLMEINKEYVKSGLFMKVGKKDRKYLESQILLENKSQSDIFPKVEIVFFNGTGYQVGISRIGYNKDGSPTREILERGEVRSFANSLEITSEAEPEFFLVKLRTD